MRPTIDLNMSTATCFNILEVKQNRLSLFYSEDCRNIDGCIHEFYLRV